MAVTWLLMTNLCNVFLLRTCLNRESLSLLVLLTSLLILFLLLLRRDWMRLIRLRNALSLLGDCLT